MGQLAKRPVGQLARPVLEKTPEAWNLALLPAGGEFALSRTGRIS